MPHVKQQIRGKILKDFAPQCPMIELLKRIRQVMESGSTKCHKFSTLVEVLIEFFTCEEKKGMTLLACKKIFEAQRNAVENASGTERVQEFPKKTEAYKAKATAADQDTYLKTTAINEFYATLFGKNVNQTLYSDKLQGIGTKIRK